MMKDFETGRIRGRAGAGGDGGIRGPAGLAQQRGKLRPGRAIAVGNSADMATANSGPSATRYAAERYDSANVLR